MFSPNVLSILVASSLVHAAVHPPNNRKAGLSGYEGIQTKSGFKELAPHISWYSDYNPDTPDSNGVKGIPMLWGAEGSKCNQPTQDRLSRFKKAVKNNHPDIMFGFYEPDCDCPSSSNTTRHDAAASWDKYLVPLGNAGTTLGSPSPCRQKDEKFLAPFKKFISRDWDVTSIHINKNSLQGVREDVEYYKKYGKPIWVTEFACVDDKYGFKPCTDRDQIDAFVRDAVKYLEGEGSVVAYGPSNGEGFGNVWPLFRKDGSLSKTGRTYLDAIKDL